MRRRDAARMLRLTRHEPTKETAVSQNRRTVESIYEAFGRADLVLCTDDGRRLAIRFSGKALAPAASIAHADVREGMPAVEEWRR